MNNLDAVVRQALESAMSLGRRFHVVRDDTLELGMFILDDYSVGVMASHNKPLDQNLFLATCWPDGGIDYYRKGSS